MEYLKKNPNVERVIVFSILFLAFNRYTHYIIGEVLRHFFSPPVSWFVERWQLDSDMLIRNRLQSNLDHGLFSFGFSLGQSGEYLSQVGIGGWLLTLPVFMLHKIGILSASDYSLPAPQMGISGFVGLGVIYSMVAILNAAVATWLFVKIRLTRNLLLGVIFLFFMLQPWSLAINSSLYWLIGLKLIPGLFVLKTLLVKPNFSPRDYTTLFALSALAFLSGYEFSTLVFSLVIAPLVFFSIKDNRPIREGFLEFLKLGMTVFSAFFSALILHFLIFLSKFKSITDAISHLEEIIYKRTGAGSIKIDSIYASSLESSPADVLHNYINMPVLFDPVSPPLLSVFRIWHLLLLVVIGWIWRTVFSSTFMASRTELAIGASWAVSIMGPIGWFLLARPHSAGHTHIDFTLWYFYTIPMSFALCVRRIPRFRRTYYNLKPLIGFLIAIICVVGAMYGLSLYLVT